MSTQTNDDLSIKALISTNDEEMHSKYDDEFFVQTEEEAIRLSTQIQLYESRSPDKALSDAIEANMLHVAEHQVKARGAKIDLQDLWFCVSNSPSMLSRMVVLAREQGLDINQKFRSPGSWPIYCYGPIIANLDLFLPFLEHGMDLNRKAGLSGAMMPKHIGCRLPTRSEPLIPFVAVLRGSGEVVKALLDHGMRLDNCSPLHQAFNRSLAGEAQHDSNSKDIIDILALLLSYGCDINALEYSGNDEVVQEWGSSRIRGPPLHSAIISNHVPGFEFLLSQGADPDVRSTLGLNAVEKIEQMAEKRSGSPLWQENMRSMKQLLLVYGRAEAGERFCA